ncbi:unnamed protein product, partial [Coregonus sp. 'balchen']
MVRDKSPGQLLSFLFQHDLTQTVPEATKLLQLVLTIPATTASIESGSLAGNKMREFCHLTLTMAFNYFLPPYSFQIRVGGLYLLYGLYHTQLASPKEKIRIALKDWEQIQKFYQDSLTFRVKKKPQHHKVCEEFRDRPERVKDLISTDMLQEVANIQGHYERLKASVLERSSIAVTQQDLPARLHSCVLEFLHWQDRHEDRGDADHLVAAEEKAQQVESSNRAQLLASIKTKSYGHLAEASKSRRHRQVEMDASISGTDHFQEAPKYHKSRAPSLRARTCKNLCGEVNSDVEKRFKASRKAREHLQACQTEVLLWMHHKQAARQQWSPQDGFCLEMNRRPNIGSLVLQRRTRLHGLFNNSEADYHRRQHWTAMQVK